MWPFSRQRDAVRAPPDFNQQMIEQLRAWRDIGDSFEYLGRTMIVTKHYDVDYTIIGRCPVIQFRAAVKADYADDVGVIHGVTFDAMEAIALMRSQPKPPNA